MGEENKEPQVAGATGTASPVRRVVGVVAAIVIVALLAHMVYGFFGPREDPYELAYYACESCGEHFAGRRGVPPVECPKCGQRAGVLVGWLRCRDCGHVYEGLRLRPVPGREAEFYPKRPGELPVQQVKWADGQWLAPGSEQGLRLVRSLYACPKCKSTKVGVCDPPTSPSQATPSQQAER